MRRYFTCALVVVLLAFCVGCGAEAGTGGPEETLSTGWRAYSTGGFDFAEKAFLRVVNDPDATEEHRYSALLGLASTHHFSTSPDLGKAVTYYERLADVGGERGVCQSLLGLGMVALDRGQSEQARAHLEELIRDHPERREAGEAALYLAGSYFRPTPDESVVGEYILADSSAVQRGLEVLEGRLNAYPDNPLASVMHMMLAEQYVEVSDYARAVEHLEAALDKGIASETNRGSVTWQIARIAERELSDYELAEKYYAIYVRDFRRTQQYYRASQSLERVRQLLEEGE
ncbi:MAG: tetratricopeptide repeat protein [Candidatus Brocadiia bacterium]